MLACTLRSSCCGPGDMTLCVLRALPVRRFTARTPSVHCSVASPALRDCCFGLVAMAMCVACNEEDTKALQGTLALTHTLQAMRPVDPPLPPPTLP